ncbi:MAG: hypothetical protein ACOX8O_02965 [Christensenellales bacterium]|jgi:hypothetical protein
MQRIIVVVFMMIVAVGLVGCGGDAPSSANTPSPTVEETSGVHLKTDAFPDGWIGVWDCEESAYGAVNGGNNIEFKDYGNKVAVTKSFDNYEYATDWYVYYNAESNLLSFYKDGTFPEGESWYDYKIL